MATKNRNTAARRPAAAQKTGEDVSVDASDKPVSAEGEKVTEDTTFVRGHNGKLYTTAAYAETNESRRGYDADDED